MEEVDVISIMAALLSASDPIHVPGVHHVLIAADLHTMAERLMYWRMAEVRATKSMTTFTEELF